MTNASRFKTLLSILTPALLCSSGCASPDCATTQTPPATGFSPQPSASSGDAAPDASSAGASAVSVQGGAFVMSVDEVTFEPPGCRLGRDGDEAWTFELPAPTPQQPWTATERFGPHSTEYECQGDAGGFTCTSEHGHDYDGMGQAADVNLDVLYRGAWVDDEHIEGSFELAFTCSGSDCGDVAEQWTVTAFPCATSGTFTGSLE